MAKKRTKSLWIYEDQKCWFCGKTNAYHEVITIHNRNGTKCKPKRVWVHFSCAFEMEAGNGD